MGAGLDMGHRTIRVGLDLGHTTICWNILERFITSDPAVLRS